MKEKLSLGIVHITELCIGNSETLLPGKDRRRLKSEYYCNLIKEAKNDSPECGNPLKRLFRLTV